MASDKLFSDDYLDQLNPQMQAEQGPVTVFGLTFKNDEERRQYFREELRRRLPELRKIEGFPIGEDDDIINLSDPPYYTACPNPWLNDFVAQWEEEKKELQREGKRKADFEVKEPYASDVSEGKNNPIYMAHAYHTKCPHPAIMRYILVRHGICSDLSPVATLIAASYNLKFDAKDFEKKANAILDQVEQELGWMYETEVNGKKAKINYTIWSDVFICPSCGNEITLWNESVDLDNNIIKDKFPCPHCGFECSKKNMEKAWETSYDPLISETTKTIKKIPVANNVSTPVRGDFRLSSMDFELFKSVEKIPNHNYIGQIPDGDESHRNYSIGFYHIHQLFTKRNHLYLSRVKELTNGDVILSAWFTSVIQNASKMYKFRLDRKGGIVSGTLFTPSLNIEQNPYRLLKGKIRDFIATFYSTRGNSTISLLSATNLETIGDNCIDYMFIDPPFGANIMYSELSSIWEGWLKVRTNNQKEAIVNVYQHKALFEYQRLMNESLTEFYRILKPGKWLTMEFSNTSASVWNSIQNALQGVGFVVANVAALDKKQGSFKAVTTTTAVKQDLVITCYKPSDELTDKLSLSNSKKESVWDFISEHLAHLPIHIERGNATTTVVERSPKILFDRLISYYVQKGYAIPLDAQEFQQGLHERYAERDGMFFTATQAVEYEEKMLKAPEFVPMGIMVSDEANGIEWLKNELRNNPQTRQDIFTNWTKAIAGVRKGDVIPELDTLLEENFIQNEDGTWRLANVNDDVDLEKLRTKALLKEFKLYLEVCRKPRGKLKDVRVEAVRAGFKQCYSDKNFADIILVGDRIPQNLLTEDEILLQYYDIASSKV